MARRSPNLKQLEAAMANSELPVTMPVLVESDTQRLAWRRSMQDALDERALIDMQIESLHRTANHARDESDRICEARIHAANVARDRENVDTEKVERAGVTALEARQADIDRMLAGYEAALGATS